MAYQGYYIAVGFDHSLVKAQAMLEAEGEEQGWHFQVAPVPDHPESPAPERHEAGCCSEVGGENSAKAGIGPPFLVAEKPFEIVPKIVSTRGRNRYFQ